jgi:hypothetical protein
MQSLISAGILLTLINLSGITGCALMQSTNPPPETMDPVEQVYTAKFDAVWLATQKALAAYPIRLNDMDVRILETESITTDKYWNPPHLSKLTSGDEYRLIVRVIEGDIDGAQAQKVSVSKIVHRKKDFFSNKQQIPSSGLEEKALLYRIQRELTIEKALEKAQKKSSGF